MLPAGLLPPVVPLSVFHTFEDLRTGKYKGGEKIAAGYEYYFMIDQDPQEINSSPIGGKIIGLHAPFKKIKPPLSLKWRVLDKYVFKPEVTANPMEKILKTLRFAEAVGAEYVVFHGSDLMEFDRSDDFSRLVKTSLKEKIKIYVEHEPTDYLRNFLKPPIPSWLSQPVELYEKFGLKIVFDPAHLEKEEEISTAWEKLTAYGKGDVNKIVGHIHLNERLPKIGSDQGVLKSKEMADLLTKIKNSNYRGYFNFEIQPVQDIADTFVAGLYLCYALWGGGRLLISKLYAKKAQEYLYESVKFAKKYLEN